MSLPVSMASLSILGVLLVAAAWSDFKAHRIPNALVFPGMAIGLLLNGFVLTHSLVSGVWHAPGTGGFMFGLAGLGLGFACLLPFYLLRAMGAGDVKLMAMVGAFLGSGDVLGAVLFGFLAGGLMALVVAARQRTFGLMLQNLRFMLLGGFVNVMVGRGPVLESPVQVAGRLPYGIAIAAGTFAWVAWSAVV